MKKIILIIILTTFSFNFIFSNPNVDLMDACDLSGNLKNVIKAIKNGANVNYANEYGHTPLMLACLRENVEIVKYLIKSGANVNFKSSDGKSALILVSQKKIKPEIIKLLIDAGADVNITDSRGLTPLIWASIFQNKQTIELLLINNAEIKDNYGKPALLFASNSGDLDIIKLLVKKGLDVNKRINLNGETILIYASYRGHTEIVKFLIENQADINIKTNDGMSALQAAEKKKHNEIVKLLKQAGARE